jgi:hypothetical protein
MPKAWRRAAVAALAGAAAIAAQFIAVGPAQAAAPTISINAKSKLSPVTGDVLVVYRAPGGFASASIHGKIAGASAGDVATLYAQQFPFKKPAVPLASKTLTASTQVYAFTVTPTLATKYAVRLFPSKTSHTLLATSKVQNVYVTPDGTFSTPTRSCSGTTCHAGFSVFVFLPTSALGIEMGKHVYPYFGLSLVPPPGTPPAPHWLYLNAGHPSVKVSRINAGEFKITLGFTFSVDHDNARWDFLECQKDTLTKDGLGLPGSHGCGASRVAATVNYLG